MPESRAEICIAFARGNVGRAKALASSEDFDKIRTSALSLLKNIREMDTSKVMDALKQIREYGFDINDYLDICAVWYRDILLFKATHDMNHLIFRDEITSIKKAAQLSDYDIWLAQYRAPEPDYQGRYSIWQYTSKGTVDGITGFVDLDLVKK